MRTVISITEYMSMRGRYKATVQAPGKRVFETEAGRGPGAAAATAVNLAMGHDAIIVADKAVMALIPKEYGGEK